MKDVLVQERSLKRSKNTCLKYYPRAQNLKEYNKEPIFSKYKIEKEILKMFEPEVKLRSGGYLVINPTEALVAIDVNLAEQQKREILKKTALKQI